MNESKRHVDYLLRCSKPSLESFELSRLNQIANLRKELRGLVEAWIDAEVEARLARWVLERQRDRDNDQGLIVFPAMQPLACTVRRQKLAPRPCFTANRRASNAG
jgi:hypothetical protein